MEILLMVVLAILYASAAFGFGMLIGRIYYDLKSKQKEKNMLNQIVSIEVSDNGIFTNRNLSVRDLIYEMEHWQCTPFTPKQILSAVEIRTMACGWSYTSFTLVMPYGYTIESDVIYEDRDA